MKLDKAIKSHAKEDWREVYHVPDEVMTLHDAIFKLTDEKRRQVYDHAVDAMYQELPVIQKLQKHVRLEKLYPRMVNNERIRYDTLVQYNKYDCENPQANSATVLSDIDFDPSSLIDLGIFLGNRQIDYLRGQLPSILEDLDKRRLLESARAAAWDEVKHVLQNFEQLLEEEIFSEILLDGCVYFRIILSHIQLTEYDGKGVDLWDFLRAVINLNTKARLGEHEEQWNLAAIRDKMNVMNVMMDFEKPEWTTPKIRTISRRLEYRLKNLKSEVGI